MVAARAEVLVRRTAPGAGVARLAGVSMACWLEQRQADPKRQQAWHRSCRGTYMKRNLSGEHVPCRCPGHEPTETRNGAKLRQ
jgi:hypothetical protein